MTFLSENGVKVRNEVETSSAHCCFRMNMGFNDGSDAKRHFIGLSQKYYRN